MHVSASLYCSYYCIKIYTHIHLKSSFLSKRLKEKYKNNPVNLYENNIKTKINQSIRLKLKSHWIFYFYKMLKLLVNYFLQLYLSFILFQGKNIVYNLFFFLWELSYSIFFLNLKAIKTKRRKKILNEVIMFFFSMKLLCLSKLFYISFLCNFLFTSLF